VIQKKSFITLTPGRSRAVLGLVGIVQAVVVSVANPRLRDAPLVLAGEVPGVGAGRKRRFGARIRSAGLVVGVESLSVGTSAPGGNSDA